MEIRDLHKSQANSLKTWSRLSDLGLLKYTKEWYSYVKSSNAMFSEVVSLLENQLQRVTDPVSHLVEDISHKYPSAVENLDSTGVACLNAIENGVEKAHNMTSTISTLDMHKSISMFMIDCLDCMISASENVADYMSTEVRLVPHRSLSKDGSTQTTEDEDADDKPTKATKRVTIPESALSSKFAKQISFENSARDILTAPVRFSAKTLNFCLVWLKRKCVTSSKSTSTYPSLRKSTGRRKVKPTAIKRTRNGMISLRRVFGVFVKYSGLKAFAAFITKFSSKDTDSIDEIFREVGSRSKDSKEKRKYSDLDDDDSSSESGYDPLNLEGYNSEEDRDWQPTNEDLRLIKKDMDDSLEYNTDDDSFVDIQENGVEDKPVSKKSTQANAENGTAMPSTKPPTPPSEKRNTSLSQDPEHKDSAAKKGNEMSSKTCEVMSKKSGIPLKSENKENKAPTSK